MTQKLTINSVTRTDITDADDNVVDYVMTIAYTLENAQGSYFSNYTAASKELPAAPTEEEVKKLILSLYA